jgi:hypothetical protein
MAVNFEIKGMLARLLATEDLIVEHKNVETACFNVHTRVLTLPMWQKASGVVYDMLVSHEVSHALYTPDKDMNIFGVPHQIINVVEDARVEKLIKRRYMGLAKTFYNAYKDLQEEDFFMLGDDDISTYNLADRVNLYFKIGNFVTISFNQDEQEIVDEIALIETFEDTIVAAKNLYEYCKKEQKKELQDLPEMNSHQQAGGNEGSQPEQQSEMFNDGHDEDFGSQSHPEFSEDGEEQIKQSTEIGQSSSSIDNEERDLEVKTANSLKSAIENLVNKSCWENNYIEVPSLDLNTVIVDNKEIHSYIENYYCDQQKFNDEESKKSEFIKSKNILLESDIEYQKFKKSSQKEVNYLVKEFECRKAADSYFRSTVSRTGILDCSKLHTYKYNEDIFKKVTTLAEGKNHGLIFVLDWSGSMASVMHDTIKQLFNLVWFCRKVSIPFEVYAFTGDWIRISYDKNNNPILPKSSYSKKAGVLSINEHFSMMNFLTSKVNGSTLEQQMKNLWRVSLGFSNRYDLGYPHRLSLSGTPLNEAMISLYSIIPHFQKINKLQKVQCVVLTDGEASPIPYHVEIQRNKFSEPYIGLRRINSETTYLRDRKLGTTYKIGNEYYEFTDVLIRNLRDKFTYVNFIGMRIMEGRDMTSFVNRYYGYYGSEREKVINDWKKIKSFSLDKTAYNRYFGLSSSVLSQDSSFEVVDGATKSQIKSAFVKSLKSKKLNKKVLGEFIELVA